MNNIYAGRKCRVCGRVLKNPDSRKAGYGPVCYKRLFGISLRISHSNSISETSNMPYQMLKGQVTMEEYLQTVLE